MDDVTRLPTRSPIGAQIDARGVTQMRLAAALQLSQPAVSRRMRGEVDWSLRELRVVAELLDVPLSSLLAEVEPVGESA